MTKNIDIIGKKKYFFALSILLILAGIVGYIVNGGFKLDIQFEGGTIIEMHMPNSDFETKKVEEIVKTQINKEVQAAKSKDTAKNVDLLTINVSKENTLTGDEQNKIIDAIRAQYNVKQDSELYVQKVEPFIGKEIMNNGLKAIFWSSILIILYVWWRFRVMSGLSAGVFAVVGLLHDCLILLSVYAVFKIPVNESFIAAALTIIGYSMNDVIIIYDRIRENSSLMRKTPIGELVNTSIVQTLSRSINTVVTVLICLITVYLFASYNRISSITEFTFPLIVGIASGCYSSICISSPMWVLWKEHVAKSKVAAKSKIA
jgi:protein-export membrane protein SecF